MTVKKPIIINAFHGLGDIIFSIPIYRKMIAEGHTVIHPYLDSYGPIWKHWPEITWIPKAMLSINYDNRSVIDRADYSICPLRWANNILQNKDDTTCMRAKYDFLNEDFMEWRKTTWVRDLESERVLFDSLNIQPGEPYCVVNNTFLHNHSGRVRITPPAGMRVIEIKKTGFFTLMDWGLVLENASEIHTVGTSLNYMLDVDMLDIKCPMHVYVRRPKEKDFSNYNYLMRKDYVWHM